jgi:4-amino-4-deoxy-L-arabinose transferase-like glycosyltransferase
MNWKHTNHKIFLVIILLYGLLLSVFSLDYNSVFIDEAYHITMGKEILRGEPCPGCPFATGSVRIHPTLAAIGDMIGGIHGARMVNVLFGLGLTAIVYLTAVTLFEGSYGLITAFIFMCSGQTLYLMKLATYDMIAAFFLGASFCMFVVSAKAKTPWYRNMAIVGGSAALMLASITKYLLPVFIPALVLYVFFTHGFKRTLLYCVIPLVVLFGLYVLFDQYGPRTTVINQVRTYRDIKVPLETVFSRAFRWIALILLLAVFGVFHGKRGKTALMLIGLSSPIILLHLVTRAEQSVNKNMIFSIIFLAPAAALGVVHMATIFSTGTRSRAVRTFFTAAVLVIFWAYGFYNLKWLERQYPNVAPVIEFFEKNGHDGMTVAFNGWDGIIYEYTLGSRFPAARFINLREAKKTEFPFPGFAERIDYVVCEDLYYGMLTPCSQFERYFENDYVLLKNFTIEHSWGTTNAMIYGRR